MKYCKMIAISSLSLLLLSVAIVEFVPSAKADTWINITLPYQVVTAGNYRITNDYTGIGASLHGIYYALDIADCSNVVVDGQNHVINLTSQNSYDVYLGTSDSRVADINLENLVTCGGTYCIFSANSTNVSLQNDVAVGTVVVGDADSNSIAATTLVNCTINKTTSITSGSILASGNLNIMSSTVNSGLYGVIQLNSPSNNLTINGCNLNGGSLSSENALSVTISNNIVSNDQLMASNGNSVTVSNNVFTTGSLALNVADFTNAQVTGNVFNGNGLGSAVQLQDTNCMLSSDTFINNQDAITWYATDQTSLYKMNAYNNNFQNNNFTFCLGYSLPSNCINQKLTFYNNIVNDTAYSDPSAYQYWQTPSIPQAALALNSTTGNSWNHPDGTGYSQIAANLGNGFAAPFDFFGNSTIYDYLPYSSQPAKTSNGNTNTAGPTLLTPPPTPGLRGRASPTPLATPSSAPFLMLSPSPSFVLVIVLVLVVLAWIYWKNKKTK